MGDYIYTLLIIGWIIFGIVKATSKNKKVPNVAKKAGHIYTAPQQEKQRNTTSALEELLEGFLGGEIPKNDKKEISQLEFEQEIAADSLQIPSENNLNSSLDSYSGTDNVQSVFVAEDQEPSSLSKPEESIDIQQTETQEEEEYNHIDLRQAIIYQAVLERPY
ncbi:MAG: hypothetical protein B7C24_03315 [Bacteroidetes bacterium 4572_77]|nr:MAG: hypothetical protein B7C24_03315 [Bacteroidetes bacterium 4572_77]